MNPIPENDEILLDIIKLLDSPNEKDISIQYFIENFILDLKDAVFEECESEDEKIKLKLIHNIKYSIKGIDIDGDTPIMRIFTLETQNDIRYFNAMGSDYVVGVPNEHNKEKFFKFLNNQPNLKNNHLTKYLKNTILLKELEENLSRTDMKSKKTKI